MRVTLTNVRLAFPQLFEAKAVAGSENATFSASLLIEPGSRNAGLVDKAIDQVAAEKWGAKAAGHLAALRKADKVCLHDGDNKAYDGFPGMLYVSTSNKVRPTVVDVDRSPLVAADGRPYAGCYVNAIVDVWAQDNQFGKRVNASLMGVQFAKDGDAFTAGGAASADDFDDVSAGADASSLV